MRDDDGQCKVACFGHQKRRVLGAKSARGGRDRFLRGVPCRDVAVGGDRIGVRIRGVVAPNADSGLERRVLPIRIELGDRPREGERQESRSEGTLHREGALIWK